MIDEVTITLALRGSDGLFVEPGCAPPRRAPGLCVAVQTDTAFHLPLADIVLRAVAERIKIEPETASCIELALHEAVANAVMHGNLEICNEGRGGISSYANFCRNVQEALQNPVFARRRVTINAWWVGKRMCFAVSDVGHGFTPPADTPAGETPHGRGIMLMQTLAKTVHWNQHRRRIVLTFPLSADNAA